jgi:hypothetical protein
LQVLKWLRRFLLWDWKTLHCPNGAAVHVAVDSKELPCRWRSSVVIKLYKQEASISPVSSGNKECRRALRSCLPAARPRTNTRGCGVCLNEQVSVEKVVCPRPPWWSSEPVDADGSPWRGPTECLNRSVSPSLKPLTPSCSWGLNQTHELWPFLFNLGTFSFH